jgi:hypothetical protein
MADTEWVKRGARCEWGPPERKAVVGQHGVVVSVAKGTALVRLDSGADVYLSVEHLRRPEGKPGAQ